MKASGDGVTWTGERGAHYINLAGKAKSEQGKKDHRDGDDGRAIEQVPRPQQVATPSVTATIVTSCCD